MIKKLLAFLLTFSLLISFSSFFTQSAFALTNNKQCTITTSGPFQEGQTRVSFTVTNTGLTRGTTYYAHVVNGGFADSNVGTIQDFHFDTGTADNPPSDKKDLSMTVGGITKGAIGTLSVYIGVSDFQTGAASNSTWACIEKFDIVPSNSGGQRCTLIKSSTNDPVNGKQYTTQTLEAVGLDPNSLQGNDANIQYFRIIWWKADKSIIGSDNIMNNIPKSSLTSSPNSIPGWPFLKYNETTNYFPQGDYVIGILDNSDLIHNTDHALCTIEMSISLGGTDAPGPIPGGGSCKYCPAGYYVSGENPPICSPGIEILSSSCPNTDSNGVPIICSPVYGCVSQAAAWQGGGSAGDIRTTPLCPRGEVDNGTCKEFNSGLGFFLPTDPGKFISVIFGIVLSLSGGIATLLIIISGYRLMASQGNPEKMQAARDQLTAAIVGLLFIIFSIVILQTLGVDILHIPGFT